MSEVFSIFHPWTINFLEQGMLVSTRCDYSSFNTSILSKISSSTPFVYPLFFFGTPNLTCDSEFLKGWSCSLMTLVCLAVLFCDTSRLFVFDGIIEFYVTVFDCPLSLQLELHRNYPLLVSLSIAVFF